MICLFRNSAASILIIVLLVSISCSSGRGRVRAVPSDGEYELCPVCKGTGVIETYSSRPPQKGLKIDEKEKGCADGIGCLFTSIFALDAITDKNKTGYEDSGRRREITEEENFRSETDNPADHVGTSYVKSRIACERCNGLGWIKKNEPSGWSVDSEQTAEGFKRANELLNSTKQK